MCTYIAPSSFFSHGHLVCCIDMYMQSKKYIFNMCTYLAPSSFFSHEHLVCYIHLKKNIFDKCTCVHVYTCIHIWTPGVSYRYIYIYNNTYLYVYIYIYVYMYMYTIAHTQRRTAFLDMGIWCVV